MSNEMGKTDFVASIPLMITASMRQQLRELGETDAEIDEIKPAEANALLEYYALGVA